MERLTELLSSLEYPLAGGILTTGFVLIYKLWRFFTGDFLTPWRTDTEGARTEAQEARQEAALARQHAEEALARAWRCEAREAHLKVALAEHGIKLPLDTEDPHHPHEERPRP